MSEREKEVIPALNMNNLIGDNKMPVLLVKGGDVRQVSTPRIGDYEKACEALRVALKDTSNPQEIYRSMQACGKAIKAQSEIAELQKQGYVMGNKTKGAQLGEKRGRGRPKAAMSKAGSPSGSNGSATGIAKKGH